MNFRQFQKFNFTKFLLTWWNWSYSFEHLPHIITPLPLPQLYPTTTSVCHIIVLFTFSLSFCLFILIILINHRYVRHQLQTLSYRMTYSAWLILLQLEDFVCYHCWCWTPLYQTRNNSRRSEGWSESPLQPLWMHQWWPAGGRNWPVQPRSLAPRRRLEKYKVNQIGNINLLLSTMHICLMGQKNCLSFTVS